MSTTNGISVDNLDHAVKRPATSRDDLEARRQAAIKELQDSGYRGEAVIQYHSEPVYHAETGAQVHGFIHAHHTSVRITDDGVEDLGNP